MVWAKVDRSEMGKTVWNVGLGYDFQLAVYPKYGHDLPDSDPLTCCCWHRGGLAILATWPLICLNCF